MLVRRRYSTVNPGRITGYAVGLPEHAGNDGRPIWYGGGKLAADQTLPKLRTRWAGPQARDPLAGAGQLPRAAVRAVLRATVAQAADHATDEAGFFTRLRASGVLVRERFSEVNPGEVTGYAVTLPGCTGPDGTPRWFSGGRLHAALTLPRLRESWAHAYGERSVPVRPGSLGRNAPRSTATRPGEPPSQQNTCAAAPPPAPDQGADTAWAVADTLHTAAGATGSRALRGAADTYDRASRAPHGRIPRHTGGKPAPGRSAAARDDGGHARRRHGPRGRVGRQPGSPERCSGRAAPGPGARRPGRRRPHGRRAAPHGPHRSPETRNTTRPDTSQICQARPSRC